MIAWLLLMERTWALQSPCHNNYCKDIQLRQNTYAMRLRASVMVMVLQSVYDERNINLSKAQQVHDHLGHVGFQRLQILYRLDFLRGV